MSRLVTHGRALRPNYRLSNGLTVLTNYTWSHCISDAVSLEIAGSSYVNSADRRADRGNCAADRRHLFNLSLVASSPEFTGHKWLHRLAGGHATPITYQGRDGRQYVLITATGGNFFDRSSGDSVIAFALPETKP